MPEPSEKGRWRDWFGRRSQGEQDAATETSGPPKWSIGILNDPRTVQVPGSVLLLAGDRNEPLGMRNAPIRTQHSSIPAGVFDPDDPPTPGSGRRSSAHVAPPDENKMTKDGKIILEPQPDDSENDPLNWPAWRRDSALLSLGFYCMVGGGMTPILAAGFYDVADDYSVSVEDVSLTTALYMMGMGLGSVFASPTAILYGKRPVYLASAILFILASVWCALSPNFPSLIVARIVQGAAVSPVECLPSATIAEIFFLHERAYRIGIYTLLLLGGKNLVPLISAAIIQTLGWRWVFWIVTFIVAFGFVILFFFVPETFWDRTPSPRSRASSRRPSFLRRISSRRTVPMARPTEASGANSAHGVVTPASNAAASPTKPAKTAHVGFAPGTDPEDRPSRTPVNDPVGDHSSEIPETGRDQTQAEGEGHSAIGDPAGESHPHQELDITPVTPRSMTPAVRSSQDHARPPSSPATPSTGPGATLHDRKLSESATPSGSVSATYRSDSEKFPMREADLRRPPKVKAYTHNLRHQPAKSFTQQIKPYNGRLNHDNWFKVMIRPFVLFAYPSVLWSTAMYSCSVGWLIVVSNTMSMIFRASDSYNFNAFQAGLVYLSPFVGGIFGTAVAGKVSDVVVKYMARQNGGLYEPEFRLVMSIPILITTVIGLMGFGWSAEERNHWIVPTIFFGVISFGCSLGSTTAITFCVDSYRQYAGEALVTLNFSKNILHGLVFSLFVTHWMAADGPKTMYIWLGVIQLILCLLSIPMYIFGKRARMWTVRKNLVEKL